MESSAARKKPRLRLETDTGVGWTLIIIVLILLAVAVGFFGSSTDGDGAVVITETPSPSESDPPRVYTISYKASVFSPTNLRIHSGDTVRFHNDGLRSIRIVSDPHPEHNNLVGFDSVGDIPAGSFFSFTFAAKGTFSYHNERNFKETGTIIVR